MKTWIKYLIIGWSIVCVGIIIVSYLIMKREYVREDYGISIVYKASPNPTPGQIYNTWEILGESLFKDVDRKEGELLLLSKEEFVQAIKRAKGDLSKLKGIEIQSNSQVKDKSIYLALPLYSFTVWAIPILIFSLIGIIFQKKSS